MTTSSKSNLDAAFDDEIAGRVPPMRINVTFFVETRGAAATVTGFAATGGLEPAAIDALIAYLQARRGA